MARAALFVDDYFVGNRISSSSEQATLPARNAEDPRPGVQFAAAEGDDGWFEISIANGWIDLQEGVAVPVSVPIPPFTGKRSDAALHVQTAINASAFTTLTYTVEFLASQKCEISVSAPNVFTLLWDSGAHTGANIGLEFGFYTAADTGSTTAHQGIYERYSTSTFLLFDLGAAVAVDAFALILAGNSDTNYGSGSDSHLRVYGNATNLSNHTVSQWESYASLTLTYSGRPAESENTIQVVGQSSPVAYRYYMVSWRHFDASNEHRIGLARAFDVLWSSTRTIREMSGHGPVDPSGAIRQGDYYPISGDLVWQLPMAFDSWPVADYRAVIHKAVRARKSSPLMVAVRWDEILSGGVSADDEADQGLLLWGSITEYSLDKRTAEASEYISGELLIEQVR